MERPQKGVLTQCYLTPKDQACSFLCSIHIPLCSNTFIPFTYFLFFLLVYWTGFFCSSAQKNLYVFTYLIYLHMIFDFFGGLLKVITYQKPLPTQEQNLAKKLHLLKNKSMLKTFAYWKTPSTQEKKMSNKISPRNRGLLQNYSLQHLYKEKT